MTSSATGQFEINSLDQSSPSTSAAYAGALSPDVMRAASKTNAVACRTDVYAHFAGTVEDRHVVYGDVHVPIRVWRPKETSRAPGALLKFHGGGWVLGSSDNVEQAARTICDAAGVVVISVDYRLGLVACTWRMILF